MPLDETCATRLPAASASADAASVTTTMSPVCEVLPLEYGRVTVKLGLLPDTVNAPKLTLEPECDKAAALGTLVTASFSASSHCGLALVGVATTLNAAVGA